MRFDANPLVDQGDGCGGSVDAANILSVLFALVVPPLRLSRARVEFVRPTAYPFPLLLLSADGLCVFLVLHTPPPLRNRNKLTSQETSPPLHSSPYHLFSKCNEL
uniref:Uncharacterized protein n=1 Tax=Plectus sambesii TaxID=2011161 RepID=A0A914VCX6_9BILA